ncbi:hypothetical protein V501_01776 [Pseudogymnoascus sp. VKM F-4519 (FW-2642)]|nr:hypothetical protein V501_01776 [Pseudogymnoascus sp. VKM F-4519 (FW-2642)]
MGYLSAAAKIGFVQYLALLYQATTDSDENGSNGTASPPASSDNDPPPNKLRKRIREDEAPQESRRRSRESGRGRSRFRAPEAIQSEDLSPWERLQMRFNLTLNKSVIIATQKDGLFVAVRKFSNDPDIKKKLDMLSRIRNENFLKFLESFSFEGSQYAVFEHELARGEKLPICLRHYATLATYPTESQLAVILRQRAKNAVADSCQIATLLRILEELVM